MCAAGVHVFDVYRQQVFVSKKRRNEKLEQATHVDDSLFLSSV